LRRRTNGIDTYRRAAHIHVAAVEIGGQELSGLLGEIQQDRPGLEDRDRLGPALRLVVEDGGDAVVRRDLQEFRIELIALADVDRKDPVRKIGLFEEHRYLVAVRRGPVMEVDHRHDPAAEGDIVHRGERCDCSFTEKEAIAPHRSDKVPVLLDGEKPIVDSWVIANYLEDAYPDRPSLFGGEGGRAVGRMLNWWGDVTVVGGIFPLIVADIPGHLKPVDAAYFRKSREARLGKPLEEVTANRDKAVEGFRKSLDPLRLTLRSQSFLGGATPNYADYIVFGPFQWARVVSPFRLLEEGDPVYSWRERLLDAFDGMARQPPGHEV